MSKLLKLKQWLTVQETTNHLSGVFQETVTEADIYHFALNGDLKLSVNFINHASAKPGKIVPISEARTKERYCFDDGRYELLARERDGRIYAFRGAAADEDITDKVTLRPVLTGLPFNENSIIDLEDERVIVLSGVYDLPMIGGEQLSIMDLHMQLMTGEDVELDCMDGTFVTGQNNSIFQIYVGFDDEEIKRSEEIKGRKLDQHEKKYPGGRLPKDSIIVVRTSELSRFIQSTIEENKTEKDLTTKERKSLHLIIAALSELAECDIEKPYAAAKEIMYKIKESSHISENNVASHLKAARETVSTL